MIYSGKFVDITNTNVYYVKIGNTGATRQIKDNTDGINRNENTVCFSGKSPVTLTYDVADTFENVYVRECTINLISNFDIRQYVIAANYNDLPVEIRMTTADDTRPVTYWPIIFSGYALPMSFNQPFALRWNEFSIECTDKLGTLDYIKFHDAMHDYFYDYYRDLYPSKTDDEIEELIDGEYDTYRKPKDFLYIALHSQFTPDNIQYQIEYDYTDQTTINPIIFYGESQDDWMTSKEVIEEIGKIYGVYVWQNSNYCRCENLLLMNLDTTTAVPKEDHRATDANISVDEAYKMIKFEVDISNQDDDFIDPFDDDFITPTENSTFPTRVLTELYVKGKESDHWKNFINICSIAAQQGKPNYWYVDPDWSPLAQNMSYRDVEVYDHYCQIMKSELLDFTKGKNGQTRACYLDAGGADDPTKDVKYTLDWLKKHPGRGALLSFAATDNINDNKNTSTITLPDLESALVIQIGGHTDSSLAEGQRLQAQIENIDNWPICSFKLNSSTNITPNDQSVTNYLVINGKITLNPVNERTGTDWYDGGGKPYDFRYRRSLNTIKECQEQWAQWMNDPLVYVFGKDLLLFKRCVNLDVYSNGDDNLYYYQAYTWENKPDPYYPDPNIPQGYHWPWNQSSIIGTDGGPNDPCKNMFMFPAGKERKLLKWQGSTYKGENTEIDNLFRIPILACELKIGDKYLCENMQVANTLAKIPTTKQILFEMYSWHTASEAAALGLNTYFSLPVDPKVGDFVLGKELSIQNTCGIQLNIDETGYAIPIPYDTALNGPVEFKILGPINVGWEIIGVDTSKWLWWVYWPEVRTEMPLLSYVENIIVKDLEIKIASDNGTKGMQKNDDNDLVYYSDSNMLYTDEEEMSCEFCTSLTNNQVNDYGIDYGLNNSAILDLTGHAWYGMQNYKSYVATGDDDKIKLEEARVSEQYTIWSKPRNLLEVSLKGNHPELGVDKTNYTFDYLNGGKYRIINKELDLKTNIMKCTLKDFS